MNHLTQTPDMDSLRREVSASLDADRRAELGQFLTPSSIADYMASLFKTFEKQTHLLDPGAGIGSLSDAFIRRFAESAPAGAALELTAFEIDPSMASVLTKSAQRWRGFQSTKSHVARVEIVTEDFIESGTLSLGLSGPIYTHAILNPPYRKIGSRSRHRALLRTAGLDAVNLYAGFLGLAIASVKVGGEIVAIVPRSFCNGSYFRDFRTWLLANAAIHRIHLFDSRKDAFKEDSVLQENIIIHLQRGVAQGPVEISRSHGRSMDDLTEHTVSFEEIVWPSDRELFIHVPELRDINRPQRFQCSLDELDLTVSTGPVVDFRVKPLWRDEVGPTSVPLIYAHHFKGGVFRFPVPSKKPNAIDCTTESEKQLLPRGSYVLVKRFSTKEERRRVVAFVLSPEHVVSQKFGIENHLNYFHRNKAGIEPDLASGLAMYLNSTEFDNAFRSFSGHTQVNATDLRNMKYPTRETLVRVGANCKSRDVWSQEHIDALFSDE